MLKKNLCLFSVSLLLITICSISYCQDESAPELNKLAVIMIKETYNLIDQGGESVWKGWSEKKIPVLVIDKDVEFLINHPKPPEDFILHPTTDPDFGKIYYKRRHRLIGKS